jgi:MFS family permease
MTAATASAAAPPRRTLFAFGAVSFTYFSYAGLFGTYAPLWFQQLGYGTLAIGALASLQSSTRLFSPHAWGWLADHTGRRIQLLRIAVLLALLSACGFFVPAGYGWVAGVTVLLFVCTAGVIPISEAAFGRGGPVADVEGRAARWRGGTRRARGTARAGRRVVLRRRVLHGARTPACTRSSRCTWRRSATARRPSG